MSWADIKAAARRSVHDTFRRAAVYAGPDTVDGSVECNVRWHAAGTRVGQIGSSSAGHGEFVVMGDAIIFDRDEMAAAGLSPEQGGTVTLATGETFVLDTLAEPDGPISDVWAVTRA